jgi:hypothetical protein
VQHLAAIPPINAIADTDAAIVKQAFRVGQKKTAKSKTISGKNTFCRKTACSRARRGFSQLTYFFSIVEFAATTSQNLS